jgi:hypothetical protein
VIPKAENRLSQAIMLKPRSTRDTDRCACADPKPKSEFSKWRTPVMKIAPALIAVVIGGMMATTSEPAHAVVYCQYTNYPANCIARPGVVLGARPVARAAVARAAVTPGVGAAGIGVRRGTVGNRGGPVNRVGRR